MDLSLFLRVAWRFRILIALGLLIASGLAFLSLVRFTFADGGVRLENREPEQWLSTGRILVTQSGFPLGRSVFDEAVPVDPSNLAAGYVPRFADPARLATNAVLYAQLLESDQVRQIIGRRELPGVLDARPVIPDGTSGTALPFIDIFGTADSPGAARLTATLGVRGLRDYIERQQDRNSIPQAKRVLLEIVDSPDEAELLAGRPLARPAVAFVAVMLVVFGLVFALENLRPRVRALRGGDVFGSEHVRRSA
jgi:hypothetical protein